jgi:hypothetical protein
MVGTDTMSVSRDSTNQDTGSQYCAAVTFTLGTGAGATDLYQPLLYTDAGMRQLAGRQITFSARIRASAANAVRICIYDGAASNFSAFHPGGGAYQTLSVTATLGAGGTGGYVQIFFAASGTYYLDNANLVVGSQPADYVPMHPADDLARCLRYYEKIGGIQNNHPIVRGWSGVATQSLGALLFYKVVKAVTPTVTKVGTWVTVNTGQPAMGNLDTSIAEIYAPTTAIGFSQFYAADSTMYVTVEANP